MLMVNAISRIDPTRTTGLRARFIREINKRFGQLKRDVRESIISRDCFGIQPRELISLAATSPRQFEFGRTDAKVRGFVDWLVNLEEQTVLEITARGAIGMRIPNPWTDVYMESAYRQGIIRARAELRKLGYKVPGADEMPGGVRALMSQPAHAERTALLYTRTFEDLKTVTQFMNADIRRRVSDGLTIGLTRGIAEGKNPKVIARELYGDVAHSLDKIGRTRARMIARTEVIRAHHLANIEEYRQAEAVGVVVQGEWLTAGDACPACAALEGQRFKLDEVEGMIPAHPNCRCVARPITGAAEEAKREPVFEAPIVEAYTPKASLEQCEQWLKQRSGGAVKAVAYQQVAAFKCRGMGSRMSKTQALIQFNRVNGAIDDMMTRHKLTRLPETDIFYITKTRRGRAGYTYAPGRKPVYGISCSGEWSEAQWAAIEAWEKQTGRKWDWIKEEPHHAYCIRHEYTHLMDYQQGVTKSAEGLRKFREMRDVLRQQEGFTAAQISDYATTKPAEWLAEAMAQYTSPFYAKYKRFPARLERFLENILDKYRGET